MNIVNFWTWLWWKFRLSWQCSRVLQIWTLDCVIRITWQLCWFFPFLILLRISNRGFYKYAVQNIFSTLNDDRNISWLGRQNPGLMCADEEKDKNVQDWEEFSIDADPGNCTQPCWSMIMIRDHRIHADQWSWSAITIMLINDHDQQSSHYTCASFYICFKYWSEPIPKM